MLRRYLKSKIHMGTVTEAHLEYEGSLTIDQDLMDAVGIDHFEAVLISNANNGERFETYAIPGERGSGVLCLNGSTARKGLKGDKIIVFTFALLDEKEVATHKPNIIILDENNKIKKQGLI